MDWNTNKIFSVDVTKNENNVKTIADGLVSYSTILFKDNLVVAIRSSFTTPDEMVYFNYDSTKDIQEVKKLYNANFSNLINFDLKDPEDFKFTGAKNEEQIQGFIFKPTKFEEGKKYPLAVLIHGGPEGGFEANWSFRWNPQVWTNAGYVVVMMNPHGSSGQGIAFQDAVRDDWGGVPYKDLKLGVEYVIKTYSYIDGDRKCAAGASYGGYMVNWIQGQTDINFNCLVTHDGVFSTVAMYYATEEIWFPHAEYCPFDAVGCKPWEDKYRQRYEIFSPESYVKNWRTPHLIIHGSKDFRIPVSEGLSAFTALQVKGIPSKFLHFYEENHWVLKAENSIKWYDEVIGWFDNYTAPKTVEDKTFFMEYLE
jgi:acylaminoacyl-peptidase